ncbi:hypothetical protein CHISP_0929 [Chitinispirillum alkaliphilum]|nr:hypothetical protein CHISP_0929 [Chitinispirillum alkaliphilum]
MISKHDFQKNNPNLSEGMKAYSQDGENLGKVVALEEDHLLIEKGFFFPKDFSFRYDDIQSIGDNELIINQKKADLDVWKDEQYKGWDEYDKANQLDIPVKEEELEARKVAREKGAVRVRKVVHTEMKTFSVPVSKEEIVIEREKYPEGKEVKPGEKAFKEEEVRIPLAEEEVETTKRPVKKEDVHVKKKTVTDKEQVSGEVKKEDVKIDKEDEGRRRAA